MDRGLHHTEVSTLQLLDYYLYKVTIPTQGTVRYMYSIVYTVYCIYIYMRFNKYALIVKSKD